MLKMSVRNADYSIIHLACPFIYVLSVTPSWYTRHQIHQLYSFPYRDWHLSGIMKTKLSITDINIGYSFAEYLCGIGLRCRDLVPCLDGAEVSASGWGSGGPRFQSYSYPRLTFQSCSRYQLNQLGSKTASELTFKKLNTCGVSNTFTSLYIPWSSLTGVSSSARCSIPVTRFRTLVLKPWFEPIRYHQLIVIRKTEMRARNIVTIRLAYGIERCKEYYLFRGTWKTSAVLTIWCLSGGSQYPTFLGFIDYDLQWLPIRSINKRPPRATKTKHAYTDKWRLDWGQASCIIVYMWIIILIFFSSNDCELINNRFVVISEHVNNSASVDSFFYLEVCEMIDKTIPIRSCCKPMLVPI